MKLFIQVCFIITLLIFLGISAKAGGVPGNCFDDADCDDGLFCTPFSMCNNGTCVTQGLGCPAAIEGCVEFGFCDEENDTCPGVPNDSLCAEGEICELATGNCIELPSGPIVIIPTMGQWGMIFASIILGIFAVVALRRRIKS